MRISICIPTFRRADGFVRAARSVFKQVGLSELDVELIAIDNSPEASSLPLLKRVQERAPILMRYAHERCAGVASARNACLTLATGDLIAWLDDDQESAPLWLDRLLAAHKVLRADIVFGPVAGAAPDVPNRKYFEELHSRVGPVADTRLATPLGIGNSLMTRAVLSYAAKPFDLRNNESGGEDDRFFATAAARGAVFGWAAQARVSEHIPAERATLRYALKRAFAYGQGPCETAAAQGEKFTLARHMAIGAAQALVYGASAGVASLFGAPARMKLLDRAARGMGKLLWFRQQRFYGAAA